MRNISCDELPKDDTEAVDISSLCVLLSPQDLRGHPVRRTDLPVVVPHKLFLIPREAKVANLHGPVFCQKNVLALEVAVQNLFGVKVLDCQRHFFYYLKYLAVLEKHFATGATVATGVAVKKVEDATPRAQLGDHVVMILLVERHTHVEYDVWVPHLVHNFYLLNKVNDGLLGNTLSPESLDRNWRSHPNGLENFAVAPTTKEIRLVIELKIIKVNVETEAVLVEGLH